MRIALRCIGILLMAYGLLRYEGEHKKISNFLDELWIKFDDNVLQIHKFCLSVMHKIRIVSIALINFFFEEKIFSFKNFIRSFFFIKGILCFQISLLYLTYYIRFGNQIQLIGDYCLYYFIPFYKEIYTTPVAINVHFQQNNLLAFTIFFLITVLWGGLIYFIRKTKLRFWYIFTIPILIVLICYEWSMPMGDTITEYNDITGKVVQHFYPYSLTLKTFIFLLKSIFIPIILLIFVKIFRAILLSSNNLCSYTIKIIIMTVLGYILYCFIILGFFYAYIYRLRFFVGVSEFLPSVFSPIAAISMMVILSYIIIIITELLLHLANRLVYVLPKYKIFDKDKTFFCIGGILVLISLLPTISISNIIKLIMNKIL